jgi:hypothetical protein
MNSKRWNYNCAFYYDYLILNGENLKKKRATFYIHKNESFTSFIAKGDATGKQTFR